nr:HEAT repeat domain-containing protein [Anaerolineae bacterium]
MSTQPGPDDRTQGDLLHNLQFGTPIEQENALARLATVGEAEALDAVIAYLLEHPGDTTGLHALRVLAHKYMPQDRYGLADALLPYLISNSWQHRLYAVRLLNTYPTELAVEGLRDLIYDALDSYEKERQKRSSSPERILLERTLGETIMALANSGRLFVLPDILSLLDDPALRSVSTKALGIIGSETERLRLEDLIEDADPQVRDSAQWALHFMDERAQQFLNPPGEIPEPPPDRLSQLYWAHRKLAASPDDLIQFLITRVGIEHLILDRFVSEGQVPDLCTIVLRCYTGQTPPDHHSNQADLKGIWEYRWQGPHLQQRLDPRQAKHKIRPPLPLGRGAIMTISFPEHIDITENGLVSYDCQFQPFFGHGLVYRVFWGNGGWSFVLHRKTWAT